MAHNKQAKKNISSTTIKSKPAENERRKHTHAHRPKTKTEENQNNRTNNGKSMDRTLPSEEAKSIAGGEGRIRLYKPAIAISTHGVCAEKGFGFGQTKLWKIKHIYIRAVMPPRVNKSVLKVNLRSFA